MAITLAEIKEQSRQRADMENSSLVSEAELTEYINKSIAELHDLLAEAYGSEYFVVEGAETPIVSGTDSYALPEDFYMLKGVDLKLNGNDWKNVSRFNFNERNRYNNLGVWDLHGIVNIRYRIIGDNIQFSPVPNVNATFKLWYTPLATKLVDADDELNDFNQWAEYVIVDVAIKMLQKEESDVSVVAAQKAALIERIKSLANNRDAGAPLSISDVYAEGDDYRYSRN